MSKPRVLVLGGLGFIGRNLVDHIVQNDLASKVRVVDKKLMAMANLSKREEELFSKVECIQANLCDAEAVKRAFHDDSGDYDIVINLASSTRRSQTDEVYKQGIVELSRVVATEALKHKTTKFIEASTTEVYKPSTKPVSESGDTQPWTGEAKAKLEAEKKLKDLKGLPLIIARVAVTYGPGDVSGLAPRLCIGAVFKKTGQKLEYPSWFEDQKFSTVHVSDVCRALMHLTQHGIVGSVYNIADKFDTDQKKLNAILEKIFNIKTGTINFAQSELSKMLATEDLVNEVNGETGITWLNLLSEQKIDYSPLSPFLFKENLSNNSMSIDGSAIEKTGFSYNHPAVTEDGIRAMLKCYMEEKWFPNIL